MPFGIRMMCVSTPKPIIQSCATIWKASFRERSGLWARMRCGDSVLCASPPEINQAAMRNSGEIILEMEVGCVGSNAIGDLHFVVLKIPRPISQFDA